MNLLKFEGPMHFLKPHYDTEGPFGLPMKDAQAKALDAILKTIPDAKPKFIVTPKSPDLLPGERSDISWISTEDIDRDNEIVLSTGMDASHFKLNPIVTLQHQYNLPPVGKSIWQKRFDGKPAGIKAKTQYPKRPDEWPTDLDWQPDLTFTLVQNGLLTGKSIGFLPTKTHMPTEKEIKQSPQLANVRRIIDEWLLLEYSCVYIPCQQNAVVEAVSKGIQIPKSLQELFAIPKDWLKPQLQEAIQKHASQIDQGLLKECQQALARVNGRKLPQDLGIVDGCKVLLVDGDQIKIRPDLPEDYEEPHMDFVEAGNDMEATWIRREFGEKTFLLDGLHDISRSVPDLYHEAVERRLMSLGFCYDDAHTVANAAELQVRLQMPKSQQTPSIPFTSLDEIEKSIAKSISSIDFEKIASHAVISGIDRVRGRV